MYAGTHVHTHYSLFDGVATPAEYCKRANEIGMTSLAITDHGTLSGHREFYRTAKEHGIKPLLGIETYYTPDRFDRRDRKSRSEPLDQIYNHLVLIAKTDEGLRNLNRINQQAWTEGYFFKPRMDMELLEDLGKGLIVTSACMSGVVAKAIEVGDLTVAKTHATTLRNMFGDDYYIEIMPHNPAELNHALLELADSLDIRAIVTPDCHHATLDQKIPQEMMLLLGTHTRARPEATFAESCKCHDMMDRLDYLYGADRKMSFRDFDIHLASEEETRAALLAQGIDRDDVFSNTMVLAESVEDYNLPNNLDLLPVEYADPDKTLRGHAIKGLKARGLTSQEYKDRLDYELSVIKSKGFAPYFLMVRTIVAHAHKSGIRVGPGRGSAAGSLMAYALGITQVDPLKYHLLFERFLDPSRSDAPDIDMDFQDSRRDEMKAFTAQKYGDVASIATFTTFGGKSVIKDVSRALMIPLSDVNAVTKVINDWDDYVTSPQTMDFRNKYPEVQKYGEMLLGRIRGTGMHAAGIVASNVPLSTVAPIETRKDPKSDSRINVVAVDMDEAARIGLIKMDFLGLSTLTVIDDTLKAIERRHGIVIDLETIDLEDREVYQMLNDGLTKAVFQLEAGPYTNLVSKMGVWSFNELAASNALVRPGAANTIGKDYIDRKHGNQKVTYPHKDMEQYLKSTYGCIIYQEQVMQACMVLGGMTASEANKVRKTIAKKKDASELEPFKAKFIENAVLKVKPHVAERLWKDFEAHAGYSFNASHAVAYSMISYWTAWLKKKYPLEYMWAVMANEKDTKKVTEYVVEMQKMGLEIRLPHVNKSSVRWTIEDDALRCGLISVKNLADVSAQRVVNAAPFDSYKDLEGFIFTKGSGVNSKALESLRLIGAANFSDFEVPQQVIEDNLYDVLSWPSSNAGIPKHWHAKMTTSEDYNEGDAAIMHGLVREIKVGANWQLYDILDSTGSFKVFGNPKVVLEIGKSYIVAIADKTLVGAIPMDEIPENNSIVNYLDTSTDEGYVVAVSSRTTKAGKRMGTMIYDDGELRGVTVFPSNFTSLAPRIKPGKYYEFDVKEGRDGGLVLNGIR